MDYRIIDEYAKQEIRDGVIGLAGYNNEIGFFDFGCAVVQKDYVENQNVRIVSGGRFFNGDFVGKGMLTCLIQGDHMMAPASKIILRTLRELSYNHLKGILILVPGCTGNLFNFGLATERAKNDNLRVRLIQVNDTQEDLSIKRYGRSGLTGVVLMSKVAGAMSEEGKSLTEIYTYCSNLIENIVSVGVSGASENPQTMCKLCKKSMCKDSNIPKVDTTITQNACLYAIEDVLNLIPDDTFEQEMGKMNLKADDSVIVFINNNGSLSKVNEFNIIKELIQFLTTSLINIKRIYLGNFNISYPVTITFMKVVDQDIFTYMDAPCNAPGWQKVNQGPSNISFEEPIPGRLTRKERLSPPVRGPKLTEKAADTLLFATQFACDALISCEKQLNTIDSERGNGDTGSNLRLVSEILLRRMKKRKIISSCPFAFFESMSKLLEIAVGGTTGCIYSILFEAAASSFDQYPDTAEVTPSMWLKAFESSAEALHKYGGVKSGDGTMFDPIYSCLKVAKTELDADKNFIEAFGKGVEAAEYATLVTKKDFKYPDSGAHAVVIWMRAVFEGVKLTYPS